MSKNKLTLLIETYSSFQKRLTYDCLLLFPPIWKDFLRYVKEEKTKYKLALHAFSRRSGSGAAQMDMM